MESLQVGNDPSEATLDSSELSLLPASAPRTGSGRLAGAACHVL